MSLLLNPRRRQRRRGTSAADAAHLLCGCTGVTVCDACALPTSNLLLTGGGTGNSAP